MAGPALPWFHCWFWLALAIPGGVCASATEQQKLFAADGAADDRFGLAVDLEMDTALIGALLDDDDGSDSGAVYVFVSNGSDDWSQQAKLTSDDAQAGDLFGSSVALNADTAIIGARFEDENGNDAGAAYIFVRDGSSWSQQAKLTPDDADGGDRFGASVAVSGGRAVIGAWGDDDNGSDSGAAYVFVHDGGGSWSQQAKLTANDGGAGDEFGFSVAMAGGTVIVGASLDSDNGSDAGSAYVFVDAGNGTWDQQAKLEPADAADADRFGTSVGIAGDLVVVGARDAGAAYVFADDGVGNWTEQAKLTAADGEPADFFGGNVAIAGDTVVIGANRDDDINLNAGAVYIFVHDGVGGWSQQQKLTASDGAALDQFGRSIAMTSTTALVGVSFGDVGNAADMGSAYLFSLTSNGTPDDVRAVNVPVLPLWAYGLAILGLALLANGLAVTPRV